MAFIVSATPKVLAIDIYGHRGAAGILPEHTIAGYETSLALGVNVIDMDVNLSKDGVPIVTHDPSLNIAITRDEKGNWLKAPTPAINSLTVAEIKRFNVGRINDSSYYGREFPKQYPLDNQAIPTLEEVINFAEKISDNKIRYQIEIKSSPFLHDSFTDYKQLYKAILEVIDRLGVIDRVELQSFDLRPLLAAKKERPDVKLSFVTDENISINNVLMGQWGNLSWTAGFNVADYDNSIPKMLKSVGVSVWNPYYQDLTVEKVKDAHDHGLKVVPWSVDEETDMHKMIKFGVDGIITNRPDILRGILLIYGAQLPVGYYKKG